MYNAKKPINWKKGSASLIIMMTMCLLAVMMTVLYMTVMNVEYTKVISTTRTDAIAESAAVYAQSYDYKYNKSQAEVMVNLLTTYNNEASDFYDISSELTFPEDDLMNVTTLTSTPFFYSGFGGNDTAYARTSVTIKSVDIYGDVLVVPDDLAGGRHDVDPPIAEPDDETSVVG